MTDNSFWKRQVNKAAVLNPVDRISEVLFGMIMVLTFTGAISVYSDGRNEIKELLWAALGCNLAWGIVDAIMYLMNVLFERGYSRNVILKIKAASDEKEAAGIFSEEAPALIGSLMSDEEIVAMCRRIRALPDPGLRELLSWSDFRSALQIFFLVILCTIPVSLPFAFLHDAPVALRVSNGVALLMLFIGGYKLAGYAGFRPFVTALAYMLTGVALVSLTMALGG